MAPSGFVASHRVETLLDSMSVEQLIGQMSQIDLKMLLDDDTGDDATVRVNLSKLEYYIGHLGIGSVLNNVVGHQWNASQFRSAVVEMQQVAKKYNNPPIIYGLDSIHGANYIRGATLTPQPINLAATFNTTMAYRAGILASRDTRAAGISWLFSPASHSIRDGADCTKPLEKICWSSVKWQNP
ncbi:xylan 1-4-beta-xylosidase [Fragilaria crotonensis]|nr:xylan 1-4-beta-xylosidase [Fragilaria crotonensis]